MLPWKTSMNNPVQPEDERRLAAIMFTDMVGFTALAQRSEALRHPSLVKPVRTGMEHNQRATMHRTGRTQSFRCSLPFRIANRELIGT